MTRIAFHRPPRFTPPALPTEKLALPNPPETKDSAAIGSVLTMALTLVSSVGMAGYMITFGHPVLVVIGILLAVTAVGSVVATRMQTKQAVRRAGRRQRRRYRAHLAEARIGHARGAQTAVRRDPFTRTRIGSGRLSRDSTGSGSGARPIRTSFRFVSGSGGPNWSRRSR